MIEPRVDFQLLYEQGPCLVVAKPGGLLTQAPPHIDSLDKQVKHYLKQRDHKSGNVYLGVPHRLDRPVSGALILARHVRAARRLSEQFEGRMVRKVYWVLVEGRLDEPEGTWTDYVRKIPEVARAEVVTRSHAGARLAVLHFRVLLTADWGTWLEMELATGRMHQIRVQAAKRGHAVIGDELYGARVPFGPACEEPRDRWIALHARRLALRHPMSRQPLDVVAPLPEPWLDVNLPGQGELRCTPAGGFPERRPPEPASSS